MTHDDSAGLLGPEGPFARELPNFAPRAAQQAMAAAVEEALAERSTLIAEAGTGTGKTYAYLVPALLSGRRVIVSTGTKTLQDQLFHRDLPRVRAVLGSRVRAALLKGRANYLCRHRLEQTVQDGRLGSREQISQLAALRDWAARTLRGDRGEVAAIAEDSPLWPRVTSTTENCLGGACAHFDDCFVVKARREAQEADVVVVNHHLLLADLALKQEGFGDLLPGADAIILDEAHQLPELAGEFFSQHVSMRQLGDLAQDALAECAGVSGALSALVAPVEALEDALRRARLALDVLPERGTLAQLEDSDDMRAGLDAVAAALDGLAAALALQAERSRGLAAVHERATLLDERLARLRGGAQDSEVRWYEKSARGFVLHATPLDIAPALRALRAATRAAWVFTSATLTVAGRFDHFARQLGLDDPDTLCLDSPFDYASQALCYLPPALPDPNDARYIECMLEAIVPVLAASRGRAFLLFTSHRALKQAAAWLPARVPYPLFVQGTAPRHQLLQDFRASGHGVLLGAASFWEGVDVAGDALSVVVIDRLPFAAPDDPVLEARLDALRREGANPFMAWQVPNAVIALKQGAGRLIRDLGDRGVLMLCDPRLTAKPYGRIFLASLPAMPRSRELADVQAFFADGVQDAAAGVAAGELQRRGA